MKKHRPRREAGPAWGINAAGKLLTLLSGRG
jgi:hypothetical protein